MTDERSTIPPRSKFLRALLRSSRRDRVQQRLQTRQHSSSRAKRRPLDRREKRTVWARGYVVFRVLLRSPWREHLHQLETAPSWQWGRIVLVWGVLFLFSAGLTVNLYQLQIARAPDLVEKARQQQMVYMRPYIPRRPLVDRQGNVLAVDRLVYTLYAHPKLFKIEPTEIAARLSKILDPVTPEELLKNFEQRESGVPIAYALKEEIADRVTELSIDGLELIQQYSRLYPQQELASDAIGYVDREHRGQAGLEYSQQALLERSILALRLSRTGNGALMPDLVPEGFLDFDDQQLQISLDLRLQRAARFALKQQVEAFNAKRGAVIVMDVRDGAIRALAAEPTYDPNQYYNYDIRLFKNWTATDLYEPGSTFKPIALALALDQEVVRPDSTVNDTGVLRFGRWTISNHDYETRGARGQLNLSQILQYSSNVGMVKVMSQIARSDYYQALQNLGIDRAMGLDLPGEAAGQLKSEKKFTASAVEAATAAFGQGFSLTPFKLLQLHAAIANGGKLVTPYLVEGLVDSKGNVHFSPQRQPPRQVFSKETAKAVLGMMESVVESNSGRNARIEGYRIGGKSGTAQKASPAGGYYSNLKISSFVTLFPVDHPRYAVLAVVDEPKGENAYGSVVAAPIARSVMEAAIAIEGIPPSQPDPK
ncbi:MAG: penicillin-binding protein 2 [Cyanobacteriota bacterium]|nr:penicillin-binding protein 2 [Cyanobacteriota bacterium]